LPRGWGISRLARKFIDEWTEPGHYNGLEILAAWR
jgi:hypothetical protein